MMFKFLTRVALLSLALVTAVSAEETHTVHFENRLDT